MSTKPQFKFIAILVKLACKTILDARPPGGLFEFRHLDGWFLLELVPIWLVKTVLGSHFGW